MSRNPEYEFVPMDAQALLSQALAAYETLTGMTVQPASPEMLFLRWHTAVILQERALNNYTGNQNIPSRAEGENLDALGSCFWSTNGRAQNPPDVVCGLKSPKGSRSQS